MKKTSKRSSKKTTGKVRKTTAPVRTKARKAVTARATPKAKKKRQPTRAATAKLTTESRPYGSVEIVRFLVSPGPGPNTWNFLVQALVTPGPDETLLGPPLIALYSTPDASGQPIYGPAAMEPVVAPDHNWRKEGVVVGQKPMSARVTARFAYSVSAVYPP